MNVNDLDKQRFEAIEVFLLDQMPADARAAFMAEMERDASLRREVEMQRDNMLSVELAGFTRTLQAVSAEHIGLTAAASGWKAMLKYAAMVALLLAGALWWMARPDKHERLFAEYYVQDSGLPVPMSAVNNPVFHDAMVAYKLGDYGEARTKWGNLLQADPGNDTLRFYIANAYLAEGDAKAAIPLFQAVADQYGSAFHEKARWYLFLAYLREGRLNALPDTMLVNDPVYGDRVRAVRSRIHP